MRSTESFHRHINFLNSLLALKLHYSSNFVKMDDSKGMDIAFEEAKQSYSEGGIPVRKTGRRTPSELTVAILGYTFARRHFHKLTRF